MPRKQWSPADGETVDPNEPVEPQEDPKQPEETRADPESPPAEPEKPEMPEEPQPGPLTELQGAVRELLDYDQIAEVRLALSSRTEEIEKHLKKANALGIREEDARRRLRLIEGSDTRFGLLRIFAPEIATEQRDVFFDREKMNGRPDGDETITFRTVDGRDVTCHVEQLWEHMPDLQALHTAGIMPEHLKKEIHAQDFWHEIESDAARQLAEVGGVAG